MSSSFDWFCSFLKFSRSEEQLCSHNNKIITVWLKLGSPASSLLLAFVETIKYDPLKSLLKIHHLDAQKILFYCTIHWFWRCRTFWAFLLQCCCQGMTVAHSELSCFQIPEKLHWTELFLREPLRWLTVSDHLVTPSISNLPQKLTQSLLKAIACESDSSFFGLYSLLRSIHIPRF